jgi:predicted acetyltransferase
VSDLTVRPLRDDELPAAWELGRVTFGGPPDPPPMAVRPIPGWERLGAFDGRGRMVGKATDLGHEQWWGGRRVPTADVGGVAVVPEERGGGIARLLLTTLLERARERGAAVSALYPTVSSVYRSLGWEVAGALREVDLDTAALPRRVPSDVRVRAGEPGDLRAVQELYAQIAAAHDGLLTRSGGSFELPPAAPWPDGADGLTLVEQDGTVTGALLYERGRGYGEDGRLTAHELLATTPEAARTLVAVLGGWGSVVRTVRLSLLDGSALAHALPVERARPARTDAWMHRPVDVVRAVGSRGWPAHQRGSVSFRMRDDAAPWNTGDWRLTVEDGAGRLDRADGPPDLWLDVRGFAVLYCAAATGRGLAHAGLAGGAADPAALDLLAGGPRAALLDYF